MFVNAHLLKIDKQAVHTVRQSVPTAFPLVISKMVNQHAKPPFKEAFSLQDVLLMPVAPLGVLT